MFYLIQQIWFCLLLAAALGAFLMWLLRAWSKEEKASDLVIGWEARLDALRNENSQIKAQLQAASAKAALLTGLQADLNRQQQDYAELSNQRESAEAAWIKKNGELEADSWEKVTSLETRLAKLRTEFAGLANERESLAARLEESARTGAAHQREIEDTKNQIQEWSARCTSLEAENHESRIRLSTVTSECDRLREAANANTTSPEEQEELRRNLAAAHQELSSLRTDMAKSHDTETEWREKWHEAEARHGRAQTELAALTVRFEQLAEVESEKNRWQSEAAAFTDRFAKLEWQSNEAQTRIAELSNENERLRNKPKTTADQLVSGENEELLQRLAAAQKETANLKSHLTTASFLQDEWRNKWHDAEAKYAAAQEQLAEASTRTSAQSGLETENASLQSDLASWASKYTLLRAEADLHVSKVKALSDRLAVLEPAPPPHNAYEEADNGWRIK